MDPSSTSSRKEKLCAPSPLQVKSQHWLPNFVLTRGNSDPNAPPCISSTLGPGGYFGEIVLLSNKPRQATVTAVTDVRCLSIGREHFNQVMGPCEVKHLKKKVS